VAGATHLCIGQVLGDEEMASLRAQAEYQAALNLAYRYLSFRARSEKEMRDYLARRQVHPDTIASVIERLAELRLVDDADFARMWVEDRQRLRPRGARVLRLELRRKGIAGDVVEAALPTDDAEEVYRLAERRAGQLDRADEQAFRRRLSGYLLRRGYAYEMVSRVVSRLWEEG
jgi:regulatory protein